MPWERRKRRSLERRAGPAGTRNILGSPRGGLHHTSVTADLDPLELQTRLGSGSGSKEHSEELGVLSSAVPFIKTQKGQKLLWGQPCTLTALGTLKGFPVPK